MPANIPGAVMGGGPAKVSVLHQLLMTLAAAAMNTGSQLVAQKLAPQSAPEQALAGSQEGSLTMLQSAANASYPQQAPNADATATGVPMLQQPQAPPSAEVARQLYGAATSAAGLGNANVSSKDAMSSLRRQAPTMMDQLAPMQAKEADLARTNADVATKGDVYLASVPASMRPAARSVMLAVRGGMSSADAFTMAKNANMIPDSDEELLQLSVHKAELERYKIDTAKAQHDEASLAKFAQAWHMDPTQVSSATFTALFQTRDPYELRTRLALQYAQMVGLDGSPVYPGGAAITQADAAIRENIDQTWGLPGPGDADKVEALKSAVAVNALDGIQFGLKGNVPLPQARATAYKGLLQIYSPSINDGSLTKADLRAAVQAALDAVQASAPAGTAAAAPSGMDSLDRALRMPLGPLSGARRLINQPPTANPSIPTLTP